MEQVEFSEKVRAARIKRNISQFEFAKEIGCTWMTVWRWEHEKSMPRHDAINYWLEKIS
jgi:transcriptional regulator with XRE-family HTH domain